MNPRDEQSALRVLSGEARGIGPACLRAGLRIVEPFYSLAMRARNSLYQMGVKRQHRLGRPVISIGNITTGGTGKTPMVQWIARRLTAAGHRPGILMRGYKTAGAAISDEAVLLERSLQIPVGANPDRGVASQELLREHPEIDCFLLDDGFQHRRVWRNLDLVLIDATNPFGFGHVLPRGLLREPLAGLRRTDVVIITRADQVGASQIEELKQKIHRFNPNAPILQARHCLSALANGKESLAIESIRGRRIFSFCGIGNPTSFHRALLEAGAIDPGHRWYGDHHAYCKADIEVILQSAIEAKAEMIVTTEKDWVKIEPLLPQASAIPVWHTPVMIEFDTADAGVLMTKIQSVIDHPTST
ncbi:MAG TPA: tetraacyldisaccharide 4'-kinase [Tepidisphaeraceae bacterium]|jgi:tetraacyldisaccharide 4'-kinase|nr:tetraacyldisaccharide 4'-kinase [Tepidisphaeraceae bacterium]